MKKKKRRRRRRQDCTCRACKAGHEGHPVVTWCNILALTEKQNRLASHATVHTHTHTHTHTQDLDPDE